MDFAHWLKRAKAKEVLLYYEGHLCFARQYNKTLDLTARQVMLAYDKGLVIPVQKKVGPSTFLYLAVRTNAKP